MFVVRIDGGSLVTENDAGFNFVNNLSYAICIYETEDKANLDITKMSAVDFSLGRSRVYTIETFTP